MALEKNLNTPPYFDDFDEEKNFHRILFRPSTALQAREATQTQTILQNQIERFAGHIFKDGSVVSGVGILYWPNTHYIALADRFNSNTDLFPTDLDSSYLITNSEDSNSAVRAVIKIAKTGVSSATPELDDPLKRATNRFYLDYIGTGTDADGNDVDQFAPGDTLYIYNSDQNKFSSLDANNLFDSVDTLVSNSTFDAEGYAYCVSTGEGMIFQKGFFVRVEPHTITVRDFSTNVAGYVVGFDTVETLVDENADESLYDNALGYENENAPGAHRLKLTPTLIAKERTDIANNTNFCAIVEFDGQAPTEQNDYPQYSKIQDSLNRRTYEESGDYVIEPFRIETIASANSDTFYYQISPGVAYVRGSRVEKVGISKVEVTRAIDTEYAVNQVVTTNYGNYVICDELVGLPDFNQLDEALIYDQAQNSISDIEGVNTTPIGSVVGYCNIRSIIFENGDKGTANAQYLVYLTNIRMNSGKTFSTDAKSFVSTGSFGNTKGDFVLENNAAVIKESTQNGLLFYNGLSATRDLTNNTGVGDTSFVYLQSKNAGTLNNTGIITVTLNTAEAGGDERLNASVGTTLTGNLLEEYNLFFSNAAYSANLTGTIRVESGNVYVNGSSTTFTTDFEVGGLVRIQANSTQNYVRRITEIANNTRLTINEAVPQTNTAANYNLYWVAGSPVPLANVTIASNTQFTANVGRVLDSANQAVYASYPVKRSNAQPVRKTIKKGRFVAIDCTSNTTGPWNLGFSDVHKITNVYVGTSYDETNPDRLTWFDLDTGQRDGHYDHGQLVLKPQFASKITAATRILVKLDYFSANTTSSVGFFSVESYPIDDDNEANTNAIMTIDIPTFNGLDLRNYIDFRPRKANTAADATVAASATVNPASSNSNTFSVAAAGQFLAAPDTNFEADFQYYVPRIDLITLNPQGTFSVTKGRPAVRPTAPFVENDQSAIAEAYVPAFPSPTVREVEGMLGVLPITTTLKTNRRWTMKDIGGLAERIKTLEYYTVLNSLEQQAKDMTILDSNGNNRFKNGIFADPFNSHNIGNVSDIEYKIAIDPQETVARPVFAKHDIDFKFNPSNSANVQQTGSIVTLPYNSENYASQLYATNYRVCCESNWQWNAIVSLYPSYDVHRDEDLAPNININVDLSTPWKQFAASPFGTVYGDWRTISTQTSVATNTQTTSVDGTTTTATATTTTTTSAQQQTTSNIQVNTVTENYSLGTYVTDVSIQPYIREQEISFVVYGLKPNTTLHAFFDDVNVDEHCCPGTLSVAPGSAFQGQPNQVVAKAGAFGAALVSDASGFVCGRFRIPANEFRTGDRIFELTNVDSQTVGADAKITVGRARFTADAVEVTKGTSTLTLTQPLLGITTSTQQRTNIDVRTTVDISTLTTTTVTENPFFSFGDGGAGDDPITQSFLVQNIPADVSGIFLTQVGVFFKAKDSTLGCSVLISEMDNGFPDMTKIVGRGHLASSSILTSSTAASETIFTLDQPVYLMQGKEYAFTVAPDANSPEYVIWVAKTGERDIVSNVQVFSNPYIGTMFVSANAKTWTAIQKEDIKFNLYRARFTAPTGTAIFEDDIDEFLTITGFTKTDTNNSVRVGDSVWVVNASANVSNSANVASMTLKGLSDPFAYIQYYNEATGEVWLDSSRGGFSNTGNKTIAIYRTSDPTNTSLLTANTLIATTDIETINNNKYHAVVPKFGIMQPARTSVAVGFKGTRTSNVVDASYTTVSNEVEYEFTDYERHMMSYTNEINGISSAKSSTFKLTLSSENEYTSPVVSLNRKAGFFIENLINNDYTNEHTRYGNAISKYVSKKVVLADGQEAEDINVYLTAYRPYETDVKVYVKFWNNQDSETFDSKVWSVLEYANSGDLVYSSSSNSKDFREYKFTVPTSNAVAMGAFANVSTETFDALPGRVTTTVGSTTITGSEFSFNANTDVTNATDFIALSGANSYFTAGDVIYYRVAAGNTALTNLTSGGKYYVQASNTTGLKLSTSKTGSAIDLTKGLTETGHYLSGTNFLEQFAVGDTIKITTPDFTGIRYVTSISNNSVLTVDTGITAATSNAQYYRVHGIGGSDGTVEYYNSAGSRFLGFKEFAIKIVLLSSNPVKVPRLQDVRALALQL